MPDRARNNGVWQLSLKLILHVLQLLSFLNVTTKLKTSSEDREKVWRLRMQTGRFTVHLTTDISSNMNSSITHQNMKIVL